MRVTILIPTFNRANYLHRAIESALAQDYSDIEVIVSDNASTDTTYDVVKKYMDNPHFKYFRNNENLGMVPNWRKALYNYATGDYFVILSDDDYLVDDNYVSKALKLIESEPEIVMVYSNGYLCYEDTKKVEKLILPFKSVESGKNIFLSRSKLKTQDFCLCNVIFNRSLALELKAFSNDYNISCDSELFLKMCLYGKVGIIKDFVSVYQIHPENLIKSLNNDLKLIINNYDHVLGPYKLAKDSDLFDADELEQWRNHVMISYMMYILLTVMIFQDESYNSVVKALERKDPDALNQVFSKSKFKIYHLLSRAKLLKFIYKFIGRTGA